MITKTSEFLGYEFAIARLKIEIKISMPMKMKMMMMIAMSNDVFSYFSKPTHLLRCMNIACEYIACINTNEHTYTYRL